MDCVKCKLIFLFFVFICRTLVAVSPEQEQTELSYGHRVCRWIWTMLRLNKHIFVKPRNSSSKDYDLALILPKSFDEFYLCFFTLCAKFLENQETKNLNLLYSRCRGSF